MTQHLNFNRHAALVDNMATARGVDLEEQALRGNVSIDEITDAVFACTACTSPDSCSQWLDKPRTDAAKEAPSYCRNQSLFTRLAAE